LPIVSRIRSALKGWNAFTQLENPLAVDYSVGTPFYSSISPSRTRPRLYNDRSIVGSIYTRISIDVAAVTLRHIKLDEVGRYQDDVDSSLNACLVLEPNLDQGPRAFRQDIALSLFDKGVVAIVPVDTAVNPNTTEVFDIYSLRVGEIVNWYPKHVRVSVYNEAKGLREEILLEKRFVAIVENPLYGVMNEPNSTLQRLIRKLGLLDSVDEAASSGKLDLIIQLPYVIKSEARKQQAEQRRNDIEFQLKGSQYGIAYTDGTEKITQLNRPVENNLLKQIEFLTTLLYSQLGITDAVMNGTADEATMLNYYNRTIEPIVDAVVEAMQRSFLGPMGTKRSERIHYFRDPFKLVPVGQLAEIADKFTRNEILTSNEIRGFMGVQPAADPKADELRNSNMPLPEGAVPASAPAPAGPTTDELDSIMNEVFDGLSSDIDALVKKLGDE
jgi:hypothetical protein